MRSDPTPSCHSQIESSSVLLSLFMFFLHINKLVYEIRKICFEVFLVKGVGEFVKSLVISLSIILYKHLLSQNFISIKVEEK